jgi:ATP-dependent Lon protease
MTENAPSISDRLDVLANELFAGRVVRKDLVRQVKVGANVPVYVLEFLLGKYCATDDPAAVTAGLEVVNQTLRDNFIRPDEAEKAKAEVKRKGNHRLIDKVDVRQVEGKFWAHLASFGDKFVHIPDEVVYRYDRLLGGGVWCQLDLAFSLDEDESIKRPFYITALKPIQIAAFDMDDYLDTCRQFDRGDWLDIVIRSVGLEATELDFRTKLLTSVRLIPMAERNYNLIELGPWGTGKSFVYRETSPNAILISGGKVTVAQLFVNNSNGRIGLLGNWDVVGFDEVAALQLADSTVVNMLKDYLESGSFARGKEEMPAEASVVFIGNTSKPHVELIRTSHLFADLPPQMVDPAFLDRLHFYLPGWEIPKLERRLFTGHYGFVSDYFAEALRQLRKQTFVRAVDAEFALGTHLSARDERAVRKTVSGLLKILHPHGSWSRAELREYVELAIEGRLRVKEQLKVLAPHDYGKTSFSYIERDSDREIWVGTPERANELNDDDRPPIETGDPAVALSPQRRTLDELLAAGEGATVEFKSTLRVNLHTSQVDKVIEHEVVKAVAGFLNARGGTLLLGIDDHGQMLGLAADLATLGSKQTLDGFQLHLMNLLQQAFGPALLANIDVEIDDGLVCRIDIRAAKAPVFVKTKTGDDLYVRLQNSTRQLSVRDALDYVNAHWG